MIPEVFAPTTNAQYIENFLKNASFWKAKPVFELPEFNLGQVSFIDVNPDASKAFYKCRGLTSLSGAEKEWYTDRVENMDLMFADCLCLQELDVSGWDVSNVTSMKGMFAYCESLEELDLSNWNTENLEDILTDEDAINYDDIYFMYYVNTAVPFQEAIS